MQKYLRPGPASIPFSNRRYWYYFPKVPITSQKKTRKSRFQIEDIGIIFQKSQKRHGNPVFKWGSHHKPRKKTEIPFLNRRYRYDFPEVAITSQKKQRKSRFQIEDIGIIFQRFPSQAQKREIPFSNRRYSLYVFTHIYSKFSKQDWPTNHFQIEDIVKQPMGKRKRPFQIEDIHYTNPKFIIARPNPFQIEDRFSDNSWISSIITVNSISMYLPIYLSIYLYIYLSVCLSVYLSIYLSV